MRGESSPRKAFRVLAASAGVISKTEHASSFIKIKRGVISLRRCLSLSKGKENEGGTGRHPPRRWREHGRSCGAAKGATPRSRCCCRSCGCPRTQPIGVALPVTGGWR